MSDQDDLEDDVDYSDASGDLDVAANDANPPVGTSSMKLSPQMDPMLSDYLQQKQRMAAAQDQASRNQMLTGLARAGTYLTAGLAHTDKPVNDAPFNDMAKEDQAPVTNVINEQKGLQTTLQNQKDLMSNQRQAGDEDPTSVQSRAAQKLIKSLYPGKFDDDTLETMSKSQIGDSITKPLELDEKIKEHADEQRNKALDRASAQRDKADLKRDSDQEKAENFAMGKIDAARTDPAVKTAQMDLYASQKIKSLIAQYPDPDNLADWQVKALSGEVAKLAQGGVPGQHELDGIAPSTLIGRMGKAWGDIMDKPTSANAGAFIKQFQQYSDTISNDARAQVKGKIDSVLDIKRKDMGEDRYQKMRDSYYTRFGLNDGAGSASSGGHNLQDLIAEKQRRMAAKSAQAPAVPLPNYANPGSPQGRPSLMLPQQQNQVAGDDDSFAFGGTVQPHLPKPPPPPKMVVPRMDHRMTMPINHYACGGTVHSYADGGTVPDNHLMPDPQRAREAAQGVEKGESFAEGFQNLKNELGIGDKTPQKTKNYARGGTVGGTPAVPFNSPANDTVNAKVTPEEIVLPLSVTKARDPALAAYLFVKNEMAKRHG